MQLKMQKIYFCISNTANNAEDIFEPLNPENQEKKRL
jgi:hypothetical protein